MQEVVLIPFFMRHLLPVAGKSSAYVLSLVDCPPYDFVLTSAGKSTGRLADTLTSSGSQECVAHLKRHYKLTHTLSDGVTSVEA